MPLNVPAMLVTFLNVRRPKTSFEELNLFSLLPFSVDPLTNRNVPKTKRERFMLFMNIKHKIPMLLFYSCEGHGESAGRCVLRLAKEQHYWKHPVGRQ